MAQMGTPYIVAFHSVYQIEAVCKGKKQIWRHMFAQNNKMTGN